MLTAERSLIGGWALGPVVGRRPAGPLREAIEPLTRRRAMFVLVDERFRPAVAPDPDAVIRAASVDHAGIAPMLDAGLLDDGTPWYVCDPLPGPVLDPDASASPRRALVLAEDVAQALAALHADGVAHGLVGPLTVVPGGGRHGGEPTVLLDAGVGALVGGAAPALAAACGSSLPGDRGPAADVYALGALLLRLLTNAAAPSAALAALPLDVRALLSSLLDPDPVRRPTAGATAARLARLREQVPATGAIPVVRAPAAAAAARPAPAPAPAPAPQPAPTPAPARRTPVASFAPPPVSASAAPVPVPAPRTAGSPIVVPRLAPDVAPTLRTGPVTVRTDPFPRPLRTGGVPVPRQRRRTVRRILIAGGGVALAGLLVAVVTHLPSSQEAGVHAIAAGADDAIVGVAAGTGTGNRSISTPIATARPVAPTTPTAAVPAESPAPKASAATPTPAFLLPVVTATPLSAARGAGPLVTTPASTTPSSTTPSSTTPSSTTPSSTTPSSTTPSSAMPTPAPEPPAPTATESTAPAETPRPTATPDDSASPSATPTESASPTPSDSESPSDDATATPDPTATP